MILSLTDLILSVQISILAYVISNILTQDGFLLQNYLDFLLKLNRKRLGWLSKPLGYCDKCFGGQLSLWIWLYFNYEKYNDNLLEALFVHGSFIALTILILFIFNAINNIEIWHQKK